MRHYYNSAKAEHITNLIGFTARFIRYNQTMLTHRPQEKIDYLVIGHITIDLLSDGTQVFGGTAAYAARTAHALGLRVGIVTSLPGKKLNSVNLPANIQVFNIPAETATTFENIETSSGRVQRIHAQAAPLDLEQIPHNWRKTPIIHLGPIAQEMPSQLPSGFAPSLLGLTPQGWLRSWDADGNISPSRWQQMEPSLKQAGAAVLSIEDVQEDEELIEEMMLASRVLVITEGAEGARLYWNGDLRRFRAPSVEEVDATGAGDIFAAAFFIRLYQTRDPWEAARFGVCLASQSVTRKSLASIPTQDEIQSCQMEVL